MGTTGVVDEWARPTRTGARRVIATWEYRRPRRWARVRIVSGVALVALGAATALVGGAHPAALWWAAGLVALGFAQGAMAWWLLRIARAEGVDR